MRFISEEARELDCVNREIGFMLEQLDNNVVLTRQKLAPFLDDCFIHQNRKRKTGGQGMEGMAPVDTRTNDKVKEYQKNIKEMLLKSRVYDANEMMSEIVMDISGTPESVKIY